MFNSSNTKKVIKQFFFTLFRPIDNSNLVPITCNSSGCTLCVPHPSPLSVLLFSVLAENVIKMYLDICDLRYHITGIYDTRYLGSMLDIWRKSNLENKIYIYLVYVNIRNNKLNPYVF